MEKQMIETENGFIDREDGLIGGTGPHHKGWGGPRPYTERGI